VATTPAAGPAGVGPWPLGLLPGQGHGRAGLCLVANHDHDPDAPAEAQRAHGRPASGNPSAVAAQSPPERAARAPRVLLVDDNSTMRRVLRGLLEDAGMQVVAEATNGLEGVAQAERVRPDVVLMDWRMPQLDGIQATARIRHQLPRVQVVVFSSAVGAGSGDLARQAGASAFVAKGAPPEALCAAVLAAGQPPGPPGP
jgi:CheY-like chemotaxis protein